MIEDTKLKEQMAERKALRQKRGENERLVKKAAALERERQRSRENSRRVVGAVGTTRYSGNAPDPEDGWRRLKHIKGWNVWWRSLDDEWVQLKVTRAGLVLGKANYWVGYRPGDVFWANSRERKALEHDRPKLWGRVRGLVESITWVRKDETRSE